MKILVILVFLAGCTISTNTFAWWSFSYDDTSWSDRSGYGSRNYQPRQQMRIIKEQDYMNYYLIIQLEGIKPEEVDIQRQGPRISIQQVRGRMEENQSEYYYSSYQSYSSVSRRLTLPPGADPDVSKMKRENQEGFVRLTIPKRVF